MSKCSSRLIISVLALLGFSLPASAHPMGNFSINHYSRIEISQTAISIHAVLDYAEIPTFQLFDDWQIQTAGAAASPDLQRRVENLVESLRPHFRFLLNLIAPDLTLSNIREEVSPGAGNLPVLRVSFDLSAPWTPMPVTRLQFFDETYSERIGWKEIVLAAAGGIEFPQGNRFQIDRSDALRHYPIDAVSSSPDISSVSILLSPGGNASSAAVAPSHARGGEVSGHGAFLSGNVVRGDRLSEILSQRDLPLRMVLLAMGMAFVLGGLHAMSPGHGKTLVAAYLVGNRGTARHAFLLGAIVTFSHTVGVFALGLVTLFASSYIVPEKLYPWMGLLSGIMIVAIGFNLFRGRLSRYQHDAHDHGHGPGSHTHDIPETVTLRSLLALGVSGGIVPCPSALVVLLSAIALHRLEFGLLLLVAFSMGLAFMLVVIGVLVVRAGRLIGHTPVAERLTRVLPVASAAIVTLIGCGIAADSLASTGILHDSSLVFQTQGFVVLGLGLLLGLKHATDADHIVAVTTFVSESKSLWRSSGIGFFWGIGHTLSLALAGLIVIVFRVSISHWVEARLEFLVALMLVTLGGRVLVRTLQGKIALHGHSHLHSGVTSHSHWHLHAGGTQHAHEHAGWTHLGLKPLLVGMVHGAAGSAALMLLVLSTIHSPLEAFLYILVFGFGSVAGMLAISVLLALPLHWAKERAATSYRPIQLTAGLFSCLFGLYLGIEIWSSMPR